MHFVEASTGRRPFLFIFIFASLFAASCSAHQVTASHPYNFKGYDYRSNGDIFQIITETCGDGASFYRTSRGTLAGCCMTTDSVCNFATACTSGTRRWLFGHTDYCASSETCYFWTVYATFPAPEATQSWVDIGCRNTAFGTPRNLYWATAETTTSSSSTLSTPSSSTISTSGTVQTGTTSSPPNSAATNTSGTATPASSPSKAWIAGAVSNKGNAGRGQATAGAGDDAPPQPYSISPATQPYYQLESVSAGPNSLIWIKPHDSTPPPAATQIHPTMDGSSPGYGGYGSEVRYSGAPGPEMPDGEYGRMAELPLLQVKPIKLPVFNPLPQCSQYLNTRLLPSLLSNSLSRINSSHPHKVTTLLHPYQALHPIQSPSQPAPQQGYFAAQPQQQQQQWNMQEQQFVSPLTPAATPGSMPVSGHGYPQGVPGQQQGGYYVPQQ
ncbi:hypothetical protein QBC44DRAFT_363602 [Cladorrhinum sp. PSN332]|nr:hypothetical protein QBC44DRAFT_363602 [Cladorrhinum sp. PSN332]